MKKKNIWKIVGIVFAIICAGALLLSIGAVFSSSILPQKNSDNLIKVNDTYIRTQKTDYGLTVNVDGYGIIKLSGDTSENVDLAVQTLTLSPGTYTISGIKHPNISKMYLAATWGTGNVAYAGLENDTFTLEEETIVSVVLHIEGNDGDKSNIEWGNKTIEPVLVKGDEPGKFYA